MRHQGKITIRKDEQGCGFIAPNAGNNQVLAISRPSCCGRIGQKLPVSNIGEKVRYRTRSGQKRHVKLSAVIPFFTISLTM
jgi:hypothetical protein